MTPSKLNDTTVWIDTSSSQRGKESKHLPELLCLNTYNLCCFIGQINSNSEAATANHLIHVFAFIHVHGQQCIFIPLIHLKYVVQHQHVSHT